MQGTETFLKKTTVGAVGKKCFLEESSEVLSSWCNCRHLRVFIFKWSRSSWAFKVENSISNSLIVLASEVVCFPCLFFPILESKRIVMMTTALEKHPKDKAFVFVPVLGWRVQSWAAGTAVQSWALYQTLAGQKVLSVGSQHRLSKRFCCHTFFFNTPDLQRGTLPKQDTTCALKVFNGI